jgi:tRNA pseudouridine32 synthase/23S rRNA pseudouridine746 synthase
MNAGNGKRQGVRGRNSGPAHRADAGRPSEGPRPKPPRPHESHPSHGSHGSHQSPGRTARASGQAERRGPRARSAPDEICLRTRKDDLILQVLHEDRETIVIDKPPGWMLAPVDWDRTQRNLMRLLVEGVQRGEHWAVKRNIRFIRPAHRLDADTSGALLLARNPLALRRLNRLFATRQVRKLYLAVVYGRPHRSEWQCDLPLSFTPGPAGRVRVDPHEGRPALTRFRVLQSAGALSLVECEPVTGRTHQIRVHLESAGHPIVGDPLYRRGGPPQVDPSASGLALRAALLQWPGVRGMESAVAPCDELARRHGFQVPNLLGP